MHSNRSVTHLGPLFSKDLLRRDRTTNPHAFRTWAHSDLRRRAREGSICSLAQIDQFQFPIQVDSWKSPLKTYVFFLFIILVGDILDSCCAPRNDTRTHTYAFIYCPFPYRSLQKLPYLKSPVFRSVGKHMCQNGGSPNSL